MTEPQRPLYDQSSKDQPIPEDDGIHTYVRNLQLKTIFKEGVTIHSFNASHPSPSEQLAKNVELWYREKKIGSGGFSTVWLESTKLPNSKKRLRAVKQLPAVKSKQKLAKQYTRELEAIAMFSHRKVCSPISNYP
jgi:hypothetical protein